MTGFVLNAVYISVYQIWKEALSVHVHIGRLNGMLAAAVQQPKGDVPDDWCPRLLIPSLSFFFVSALQRSYY
jgi:hypothetical protein